MLTPAAPEGSGFRNDTRRLFVVGFFFTSLAGLGLANAGNGKAVFTELRPYWELVVPPGGASPWRDGRALEASAVPVPLPATLLSAIIKKTFPTSSSWLPWCFRGHPVPSHHHPVFPPTPSPCEDERRPRGVQGEGPQQSSSQGELSGLFARLCIFSDFG